MTRIPRSLAVRITSTRSPDVAEPRVDPVEVGDVVAVVVVGRRVERHQPQARDAQVGQVVDPLDQARQVADAVVVPVHERLDVQAVDDGVLPPQVTGVVDPHAVTCFSWGSRCSAAMSTNASSVALRGVLVGAASSCFSSSGAGSVATWCR